MVAKSGAAQALAQKKLAIWRLYLDVPGIGGLEPITITHTRPGEHTKNYGNNTIFNGNIHYFYGHFQ